MMLYFQSSLLNAFWWKGNNVSSTYAEVNK